MPVVVFVNVLVNWFEQLIVDVEKEAFGPLTVII